MLREAPGGRPTLHRRFAGLGRDGTWVVPTQGGCCTTSSAASPLVLGRTGMWKGGCQNRDSSVSPKEINCDLRTCCFAAAGRGSDSLHATT